MISAIRMSYLYLLRYVPSQGAWIEALGFVLIGMGLFLTASLISYAPTDYSGVLSLSSGSVENLCGSGGALAGAFLFHSLGIMAFSFPGVCLIWGVLTVLGFYVTPTARRLTGGPILIVSLASLCTVHVTSFGLYEPLHGFGGLVGQRLTAPLLLLFDNVGTTIILFVSALVGLVLTGNLAFSNTAHYYRKNYKQVKQVFGASVHMVLVKLGAKHLTEQVAGVVTSAIEVQEVDKINRVARKVKKAEASKELEQLAAVNEAPSEGTLEINFRGPAHKKPDAGMFSKSKAVSGASDYTAKLSEQLVHKLKDFSVFGELRGVQMGPVVSTIEFEPSAGTKVSKITGMQGDLARMMKAESLRVIAPIPGKDVVGFEIPNQERAQIGLSELLLNKSFKSLSKQLPIVMGVDTFGQPIIEDLASMPHLLVAGSTGSGKSVFINTLVASLIMRHTAKNLRFIMIDPKMVELASYNDLPHMACPVVTDPSQGALSALNNLVEEMESRYRRLKGVGAKNIESFNEKIKKGQKSSFKDYDGPWQTMPYVVLIIDEVADMMMVLGKEAETPLTRLAQKARAAGIHLVIATQRPSADVITGLVKANFPTRIAFRVLSGVDSRTILDQGGAETLLGKGDALFLSASGLKRLHAPFIGEEEIRKMAKISQK